MSVKIITDSASDVLTPYHPAVSVLPMTITFGDQQYRDKEELSHQRFYELLIESEQLPSTSQIGPAQFEEAFQAQVDAGHSVVAVILSGKLSGTYQSACIAAEEFPQKVFVVDSENAALGEGILVQRAAQLVDQGLEAPEIAQRLEDEKKDIRLIALLDTLEYLKRGGRISKSVAAIGGLLSIKPVIAVQNGEVCMLGKARGSKNGNNLLVQEIQKTTGIDFERPYCLGYSGFHNDMLQKYIADSRSLWEGHAEHLPIGTIGATIGTHIGPGAVGVAFFQKR
ncbi:MAG: DegV family protein [Oscillospiraceae bacterium]|jgi:DegV family protein with EDD domain|nr:DegV family protein [Oscillospiraceae bacterium]MCI9581221.1 DegV family protein [Oscillospiraceae bacterium]